MANSAQKQGLRKNTGQQEHVLCLKRLQTWSVGRVDNVEARKLIMNQTHFNMQNFTIFQEIIVQK